MNYKLFTENNNVQEWILPSSKSISNRVLMIRYYSKIPFEIENLSDSSDTQLLDFLIKNQQNVYDFRDAGTPYRFMLSALSIAKRRAIITGTERLMQRPIQPLIEALTSLGLKLHLVKNQIVIEEAEITQSKVFINHNESSQFLSSLLLLAPNLPHGLEISFKPISTSESYTRLTIHVLREFGIKVEEETNRYFISNQSFQTKKFFIEADWSAAAFVYLQLYASGYTNDIILKGLFKNSWQGDAIIQEYAKAFGMQSEWIDETLIIRNTKSLATANLNWDLSSTPDIVPVLVMLITLSKSTARLSGISNLELKESKRISVLIEHLAPACVEFTFQEDVLKVDAASFNESLLPLVYNPHNDHRMAMCFSALVYRKPGITILHAECVSKSFPAYWEQLANNGITLKEADSF